MVEIEVGQDWTFDFAVREGNGAPENADALPTAPNTLTQVDGVQTALTATVTQLQDNVAAAIPGIYQVVVDISARSAGEVITVVVLATLNSVNQRAVFTATIVPAQRGTDNANTVVPLAAATDQAEHDATQVAIAAIPAAPTAAANADAVWDELLNTGHGTANSAAQILIRSFYAGVCSMTLAGGSSGTVLFRGSLEDPVGNFPDAVAIMSNLGLTTLDIRSAGGASPAFASSSDLDTLRDLGATIIGDGGVLFSYQGAPNITGWSGNTFVRLNIVAAQTSGFSNCFFEDCEMEFNPARSIMVRCRLTGTITTPVTAADSNDWIDCSSVDNGGVTMDGAGTFGTQNFIRFAGSMAITNVNQADATPRFIVNLAGGTLDVDATNTEASRIVVTGFGTITGAEAANVTDNRIAVGLQAQEVRDSMKLAASAGAPVADSIDDKLDDLETQLTATDGAIATIDTNVDAILVDTGTDIPALLSTLQTSVDGVPTVAEIWAALRSGNTTTGSMGQAISILLNALASRHLIDDSTDPWQEVHFIYDEAAGVDTVEFERYDLFDQDGAAINGTPTTGNNPLNNNNVLIAERRRVL